MLKSKLIITDQMWNLWWIMIKSWVIIIDLLMSLFRQLILGENHWSSVKSMVSDWSSVERGWMNIHRSWIFMFNCFRRYSIRTQRWWRCSWSSTTWATCPPTIRPSSASAPSTCPSRVVRATYPASWSICATWSTSGEYIYWLSHSREQEEQSLELALRQPCVYYKDYLLL